MPKSLCCLVSLNAQSGDTLLVFKLQETCHANIDMVKHFCLENLSKWCSYWFWISLSEIQDELMRIFSVYVCVSTICRTLKIMVCIHQAMHRVALQRSDKQQARFMAVTCPCSCGCRCDDHNYRRKYGYCMRGIPPCDHRLLICGTCYSAIPIVSIVGCMMSTLPRRTWTKKGLPNSYWIPTLILSW